MSNTKDKVKAELHDTADRCRPQKTKDVAHNVSEKVKDAAHNVAIKTKDAAHDVGEKAIEAGHAVAGKTRDAAHGVGEKARGSRPRHCREDQGCCAKRRREDQGRGPLDALPSTTPEEAEWEPEQTVSGAGRSASNRAARRGVRGRGLERSPTIRKG